MRTLVGNSGQPDQAFTGISVLDWAQAFTTGSLASGYKLTDVKLRLPVAAGVKPTYTMYIGSKKNGSLGSSLGELTHPTSPSNRLNTFTPSGDGINLQPNTTYWVFIDTTTVGVAGTANARETNSDAEDSGGATGWSIGDDVLWKGQTNPSWSTATAHSGLLEIHG